MLKSNKTPIQHGISILLNKIEQYFINEDFKDHNKIMELDIVIKAFLSFDSQLLGLEKFLKTLIRNPKSKSYLPEINHIINSNAFLIKDRLNLAVYAFLPIYIELSGKSKKEAISELYIPSVTPYPITDEQILNVISNESHNQQYLTKRIQINKAIEITTNIVNLLISTGIDEVFINSDKYDGLLSELRVNFNQMNVKDNLYLNAIVNQLEILLENQTFNEDDINYLMSVLEILTNFLNMDFFLLNNSFSSQYLLQILNREKEITTLDFHNIILNEKIDIHKKLFYHLNQIIENAADDLKRDFDVEMQSYEFMNTDVYKIITQISNQGFLDDIQNIFTKISFFNQVYQNENFVILHDFVKSNSLKTTGAPLLFYLESLFIIPELFNNDIIILQQFKNKWGCDFILDSNNGHNFPLWIEQIQFGIEEKNQTFIEQNQENQENQNDILNIESNDLPDIHLDNGYQAANQLKPIGDLQSINNKLKNINHIIDSEHAINKNKTDLLIDNQLNDIHSIQEEIIQEKMEEMEIIEEIQNNEIQNDNTIEDNEAYMTEQLKVENEQQSTYGIQVINKELENKKIMGQKLDVSQIQLNDSIANNMDDMPIEFYREAAIEMLPPNIFAILDSGSDLTVEQFNNAYLEHAAIMNPLNLAHKMYEETNGQTIYRYFHTLKGNFASFRMILASEGFHKAAYLIQSVNKQKRNLNDDEFSILQQMVQVAITLFIKIYYTYVRDVENFIYYNEPIEKPMPYTLNVFQIDNLITEAHGKPISYTPQFKEFIHQKGYEIIDNDVYLIDNSNGSIHNHSAIDMEEIHKVTPAEVYHQYLEQHGNQIENIELKDDKLNHNGSIEIHKQPIIIELEPEHYVANGIFVQSNDGYIVNQRQRVSIQDWIMSCNVVLEETDNMVNYMRTMMGYYIGVSDIEVDMQYTVHNLDLTLNKLMNLCVTIGLHKSASLVADFIALIDEYRDVSHKEFPVDVYDQFSNHLGTNYYNNHLIREELNKPLLVVDPTLVDFTIRIGEYLHYLFSHNPLDGLNKEDVELMKYQIQNHTSKCRHLITMRGLMLNEEKRAEQIDTLTKLLSNNFTSMMQSVDTLSVNNSALMVSAQKQESSVSNLINYVENQTDIQTTILDNNSNAISNMATGLSQIDVKINTIGQYTQMILNGLSKSKLAAFIFKK